MSVAATSAGRLRAGRFSRRVVGDESYSVFYPEPLPPSPPLVIDPEMQDLLDQANQELGRLDGITLLLPNPDQFIYSYVRKEAVLSSQIEGTQSSLSDLVLFEYDAVPGVPLEDVRETSNYVHAMEHGLQRIAGGFPLCSRLVREIHARLVEGGRGGDRAPGEFRRTQNWIGGTQPGNAVFVPPPPEEVGGAMGALERFLHDDPVRTPILVKAALAHAQFETIHPFLDGNGRVGRLLVTLILSAEGRVLSRPLLYLSLYLKENRDTYYDLLQRVRSEGAWEEWLRFFLEGIVAVARAAIATTRGVIDLVERDRGRVLGLGRAAGSATRLHEIAVANIAFTIPRAAATLGLSEVTVGKAAAHLERLEIVREATGRSRNKVFVYDAYLELLG